TFMFGWFEAHEPALAFLGLLDWRLRRRGSLVDWVRDYLFRFNTLSLLGSMALVVGAPPLPGSSCMTWLLEVLGLVLFLNCFPMAAEILVGKALLGAAYSRYFHPDSMQLFTQLSAGKRHLWELWNFTQLVLASLTVIAAVCSAWSVMCGGFNG